MLNLILDGKTQSLFLIRIFNMVTSDIYIIKTTPYRESSNLYDAVVKGIGKVTFIHKGIKTNKKIKII